MNLKFFVAAVLSVLGIALLANAFDESVQMVDNSLSTEGEAELRVHKMEALGVEYGSLAELYEFSLKADSVYTLRDLSFSVGSSGLELGDWRVYEVVEGEVDYLNVIATEENRHDDLLHMRFASSPGVAFLGTEKTHDFVLVANVERGEGEVSLEIQLKEEPSAWVEGHFEEAWLKVDADKVNEVVGM